MKKDSKIIKLRISTLTLINIIIKSFAKFNLIDCCAEPAIEASRKEPNRVFNTNLIGTFNILKKCIKDKSNIIYPQAELFY